MQRDQKVGLALGVLLIGAVAAFFFRNEPDPSARISQLESADEVNREIAEKRLTPYFSESDGQLDEDSASSAHRPHADETRTGERRLPRWEELKSAENDPFAADSAENRIPTPAPDPIPAGNASLDPSAPQPAVPNPAPTDDLTNSAPPPLETMHEVQRGETLSSIAGKYLGSQARYQEIFEANKDQLRDANDLQVGMKLRIPTAVSPPPAKAIPVTRINSARETKPDATSEIPVNKAPVFVPASTANTTETPSADGPTPPVTEPKPEAAAEPPKRNFAPAKRRPRMSAPP